jgi:peptidoglycan/LPS O-acetylase OafA/YrhL
MRVDQLTFTRFLAALPIIIFHFGHETCLFTNETIAFLSQNGYIGVSYFFVLSGFVMMLAYGDKVEVKTSEYWIKRFARIYPAYAAALLFLYTYMISHNSPVEGTGLVLNIFAMQAYVPGHVLDFNFPGWSISVEFFFYLLFPILFNRFYKKLPFKKLSLCIIAIWIFTQVASTLILISNYYHGFPSRSHDLLSYFPPAHLSEFLIGNLAGLYYIQKLKHKKGNYDLHILLLIILMILVIKYHSVLNVHNGLLAFLYIPILILLSMNTGLITRLFKFKLFVFLGEISYGVYIFQLPAFYFLMKWLNKLQIPGPNLIFFTYVFGLILLSSLSYLLLESPIRKWINGKISKTDNSVQ